MVGHVKIFSFCLFTALKMWNYNIFSKNIEEICCKKLKQHFHTSIGNKPYIEQQFTTIGEWRVKPGQDQTTLDERAKERGLKMRTIGQTFDKNSKQDSLIYYQWQKAR